MIDVDQQSQSQSGSDAEDEMSNGIESSPHRASESAADADADADEIDSQADAENQTDSSEDIHAEAEAESDDKSDSESQSRSRSDDDESDEASVSSNNGSQILDESSENQSNSDSENHSDSMPQPQPELAGATKDEAIELSDSDDQPEPEQTKSEDPAAAASASASDAASAAASPAQQNRPDASPPRRDRTQTPASGVAPAPAPVHSPSPHLLSAKPSPVFSQLAPLVKPTSSLMSLASPARTNTNTSMQAAPIRTSPSLSASSVPVKTLGGFSLTKVPMSSLSKLGVSALTSIAPLVPSHQLSATPPHKPIEQNKRTTPQKQQQETSYTSSLDATGDSFEPIVLDSGDEDSSGLTSPYFKAHRRRNVEAEPISARQRAARAAKNVMSSRPRPTRQDFANQVRIDSSKYTDFDHLMREDKLENATSMWHSRAKDHQAAMQSSRLDHLSFLAHSQQQWQEQQRLAADARVQLAEESIDSLTDCLAKLQLPGEQRDVKPPPFHQLDPPLALRPKPLMPISTFAKQQDDMMARIEARQTEAAAQAIETTPALESVVDELIKESLSKLVHSMSHALKKRVPFNASENDRSYALLHDDSMYPDSRVLVDKFNIEVTAKELRCLCNQQWLTDEIMNFYLQLIDQRCKATLMSNHPQDATRKQRCHFFTTFFWPKLCNGAKSEYSYKAVSRWLKRAKVDITQLDSIYVPVHVNGNHWCLARVNFTQRQFEYYDSLGGEARNVFEFLRLYLRDEIGPDHIASFDLSSWRDCTMRGMPRQNNGSDCGVFTLKCADYLSENRSLDFTHRDMPYFRARAAMEIVDAEVI